MQENFTLGTTFGVVLSIIATLLLLLGSAVKEDRISNSCNSFGAFESKGIVYKCEKEKK